MALSSEEVFKQGLHLNQDSIHYGRLPDDTKMVNMLTGAHHTLREIWDASPAQAIAVAPVAEQVQMPEVTPVIPQEVQAAGFVGALMV